MRASRGRLKGALCALVAACAVWAAAPGAAAPPPVTWCGNDRATSDRTPDAVAGAQVHLIYAVPADGADRFANAASQIATEVAAIDAWCRREDPSRTVRFDFFD